MGKLSKNLIITLAVAIIGFASVGSALAATDFSISLPQGTEYEPGQTFTANISVSPSERVYTVGIQLDYPANLLEVQSFSFASTWMPLSQEGYDSIDNANGLLIKTAGYPGGINTVKTLGTVTFRAKNSGQAAIQLTSDTIALNAQNADVTGALGSVQVNISAPEVVPGEQEEEEITPPEEEVTPPAEEITPEEEEIVPEEETTLPEEEITPEEEVVTTEEEAAEKKITPLVADIGMIVGEISQSVWKIIIIIFSLIGLIIVGVKEWKRTQDKKKKI